MARLGAAGWTGDEWAEAVDGLRSRGLLADGDDLALTDAGRELRQSVEDRTDALAEPAYRMLGEDGCVRLAELAQPLSCAVVDAGLLNLRATPTAG
ncbi:MULTISPECIES: helix-turn-helix domain-containing protein [unclassified Micromonospora]|uniref:helix-turn-helix domain-containing protein n=1 Tax=unclassified Micromonospora TaxID=2617518 RepID=UPI002FF13411